MKAANIGKILGAFGLVLLLSAPVTYFVTTGDSWMSLVKAVVGAVLVGVFVATNIGQLGGMASKRGTFYFAVSALTSLVVLGGLVAVNYVAAKRNKTWDLTEKKIFSLAPQTVSALKALKEPVQVLAFMPPGSPGQATLEGLFERYREVAPDTFRYSFKDPNKTPDLAAKYQVRQGSLHVVLVRGEGDTAQHTRVEFGGAAEAEQDLTNALLKLEATGEHKVYFVVGHGEWPIEEAQGPVAPGEAGGLNSLRQTLVKEGYSVASLNLVGQKEVPKDAALVVVAGARTRISAPEEEVLRKYLDAGGRLLFFAETNAEAGLDGLLAAYGLQVDPGMVADPQFTNGSPWVPLTPFYTDHEVTRPLARMQLNVEFPTTRALTVLREGAAEGVKAQPLVLTSPFAWLETQPGEGAQPSDGEKTGQLPLVAVSTRPTAAAEERRSEEARVMAFGDSQLLLDGNWGHEPNRNLVMNAFGWATNQAQKVTIRPPDRDISTVDLDRDTLSRIRFVATDLLPLSLLGLGLAIWLTRRSK